MKLQATSPRSQQLRTLLAKALSVSKADDPVMRKTALRVAGQNAYGQYIRQLMSQLKEVNPAEREQVLQAIEEKFIQTGPKSFTEQKRWAEALQSLRKGTSADNCGHHGSSRKRWHTVGEGACLRARGDNELR